MSIQDSMTGEWFLLQGSLCTTSYPPESSLLWLQKTNLEFVWYLPLICVALLSLTLSQTVEDCYVKRDDFPTDSIQPIRQSYQNKGYCTPPHSPLCSSNCKIYPSENKTIAALFIYWTTRKTHMPCCFSNMSNRYRKRIHVRAKIEPSPTYLNHSSCKKVNFFQHCLQLGRQLLSVLLPLQLCFPAQHFGQICELQYRKKSNKFPKIILDDSWGLQMLLRTLNLGGKLQQNASTMKTRPIWVNRSCTLF